MFVIILAAIVVIGSIIGVYVLIQSSRFSPSPMVSPTPTGTPSLNPTQTSSSPLATPTPNPTANPTQTSASPSTPILTPSPIVNPTPTSTPTPAQGFINVTGFALYELSQTEFVFSSGSKIYNVTMDLNTQAINLNGKLLGGYQIVSQIIPVTSLQLTITGTVSGSTIMAQTVLIPTTKDKIT